MAYPRDPNVGIYPEGMPPPGSQMSVLPPTIYVFTPEEIRVMKECNKESFYQRCVPLMALFGGAVYYGIKSGLIKSSPRSVGSVAQVSAAVAAGFVLGKLSYKTKCEEKILSLPPDSRLRESVVKRRMQKPDIAGTLRDSLIMEPTFGPSVMPFGGGDAYPDEPRSIAELDTDRPIDTFDDSFRMRTDSAESEQNMNLPPAPSRSVTYDELRRRNREEYEAKLSRYRSGFEDSPYGQQPQQGYQGGVLQPSAPQRRVYAESSQIPISQQQQQQPPEQGIYPALPQEQQPGVPYRRPHSYREHQESQQQESGAWQAGRAKKNLYGDAWER